MSDIRMRGFNFIPPVIKNLLIINLLVFIAQITFQHDATVDNLFALHDIRSVYFKPYQLVTYMFMHGSWGHIFFNMLALWIFGASLENYWGSKRFLIFYMITGIGAGILQMATLYIELTPIIEEVKNLNILEQQEYIHSPASPLNGATVGASGAIFGCLAAFAYLFPNRLIYIYGLFPIKAKWLALIYGGIELFSGIANSSGDTVAHWAHIGGAIVGIIVVMMWHGTGRRNNY